jgi:O-acetyl-ADP-ribose deacetylase (regulator of RNase III)
MLKVKLELLKGDITERETDAIVNTANNMLILGSGLGGAIKAKGGNTIAEECSKYGTIEVGEAVITGSGHLKTKNIIHAALLEFDGLIEEKNISKSILNSLRLANKHKLVSLAIPDMSMGIVRFSPERCAEILFSVLRDFLQEENSSLHLIEIVVWDIETLRIYKKIYKEYFLENATTDQE